MKKRKLTNEEIRNIQICELEILDVIIDICNRHNIYFYLLGGTLLGAVRHKGFIPWDDDIDIGLYRGDYDKFIDICKKELPENYFCQNYKTDKDVPILYTKIRKNNTLFEEKVVTKLKCHKGIFVDIFPLDYIDKNTGLKLKIKAKLNQYLKTLYFFNVTFKTVKTIKTFRGRLFPRKLLAFIDSKIISKKRIDKYTINFMSGYNYKKEIVPSEYYGEGMLLSFEGRMLRTPLKHHEILTMVYGDYMQLPPEDKRCSAHEVNRIEF